MPDLTPITREEMFLDGNTELTPITREEKILAGEDIDVITRREWFLKKYRGGGDITVESITITENGTTTAPSGKAYSPIYTNVGLPENAYLLKDFENVPSDIVTFNDGSALPMPSLKTTIVPIQEGSGDPSPSNVRPISGWSGANVSVCGVNQFNKNATFVNAYCDYNTKIVSNNDMRSAIIPIKSGISYKIIVGGLNQGMKRYGYTKDIPQIGDILYNSNGVAGIEEYNDGDVITVPNGFNYLFITFYRYNVATDSFDDVKNAFGINYPSTDTSYHAYNGHTYTIPFQDSQGNPIEVYGGELDVVNGTSGNKKTLASVDLGTLNWALENGVFRLNESIGAKLTTDTSAVANMMCSHYKTVSQNAMGLSSTDHCIAGLNWSNGVRVKDSDYTTVDDFKTAMNGVKLVYELATPSTFTSQPTSIKSLEGTNNVWGDCGQIKEGSYFSRSEEE